MDGSALSWREQQILAGIEERLRADAELDRRMRTMRLNRLWHVWNVLRAEQEVLVLALLGAVSVLLVVGIPAVRFTPVLLIAGLILLVLAGAAGLFRPLFLSLSRRGRADRTTTRSLGELA
ncbi:DUF3040 domain-containing protein [Streptacidiphilus sp. PAMC 29251]